LHAPAADKLSPQLIKLLLQVKADLEMATSKMGRRNKNMMTHGSLNSLQFTAFCIYRQSSEVAGTHRDDSKNLHDQKDHHLHAL
jgi:hypothetical protein